MEGQPRRAGRVWRHRGVQVRPACARPDAARRHGRCGPDRVRPELRRAALLRRGDRARGPDRPVLGRGGRAAREPGPGGGLRLHRARHRRLRRAGRVGARQRPAHHGDRRERRPGGGCARHERRDVRAPAYAGQSGAARCIGAVPSRGARCGVARCGRGERAGTDGGAGRDRRRGGEGAGGGGCAVGCQGGGDRGPHARADRPGALPGQSFVREDGGGAGSCGLAARRRRHAGHRAHECSRAGWCGSGARRDRPRDAGRCPRSRRRCGRGRLRRGGGRLSSPDREDRQDQAQRGGGARWPWSSLPTRTSPPRRLHG